MSLIPYLVCDQPGSILLREKQYPVPAPDEALIAIRTVGICGTDLHAWAGRQPYFTYPRILGHELGAEVISAPAGSGLSPGDRTIVIPYLACGGCIACRRGSPNCCVRLQVLGVHTDGGMQSHISVPVRALMPVQGLSFEKMALAEPLAIGAHAVRRAAVGPEDTVLVIGCGPIGLGIICMARMRGARVWAMDLNPDRLLYAQAVMGADGGILAGPAAQAEIADRTGGDLCTVVLDATGHQGSMEHGIDYMAHGGRYVLAGLTRETLSFSHPAIHAKETTLLCSRNATREDFETVLDVLKTGLFPSDSFITHTVPYTAAPEQFAAWARPETGVIKAMLTW
ncbi:MAG: zinc-binding alcohol dehydrogenase family protein [Bacteroidia bacterium]|nr:zinc-binding alcohol dehydrogenase family protein [Bacteroidia bacterium]